MEGKSNTKLSQIPDKRYTADAESIYIREINQIKTLNAKEERAMADKAVAGDQIAYQGIITANLRNVVKIARSYSNRGVPFMDLVEEGNIGLMHALNKFEPERGFRFTTYASWWVRQYIERAIMYQSRSVRLPVYVLKELNQYLTMSRKMSAELQREPTPEEIAERMERDPANVRRVMELHPASKSLNAALNSDANSTLNDFISYEEAETPEQILGRNKNQTLLYQILDQLTEEEQNVMIYRYGLYNKEPMTLEATGQKLGLAREKVRQIQLKCLTKLRRHAMNSKLYSDDV